MYNKLIKFSIDLPCEPFENLQSAQSDRTKVMRYSFSERFGQQPRRAIIECNVSNEIRLDDEIRTERPGEVNRRVIDLD